MDYIEKGAVFNVLFADCVFVADNSPQATRLGIATKDQFLSINVILLLHWFVRKVIISFTFVYTVLV